MHTVSKGSARSMLRRQRHVHNNLDGHVPHCKLLHLLYTVGGSAHLEATSEVVAGDPHVIVDIEHGIRPQICTPKKGLKDRSICSLLPCLQQLLDLFYSQADNTLLDTLVDVGASAGHLSEVAIGRCGVTSHRSALLSTP